MLSPLMSRRSLSIVAALLAALALAGVFAACGEEQETEVVEGEPIELADLSYNIGLTRFLNPDDNEDAEYLVGQPPADPGFAYLGVFLTIQNETDGELPSAEDYVVRDTLENEYLPIESESPYALEIGAVVPAEDELPLPDTTAQTGPNQGSLLLFLVEDSVSENRPLKLEIDTAAGAGDVILDI
jgi:hypothetical protein